MPTERRRDAETGNGSDGWLSTGASIVSSTIIPSAKPPVKHMPTAPTPGTAALLVRLGGQAAQPADDRAGAVERERGELLRHAHLGHRLDRVPDAHLAAGRAEQRRHAHAEPGVDDALRELDDLWVQSGHLVDHDDRRSRAARVHGTRQAVVRERRLGEAGKVHAHGVEHYGLTIP